MSPDLAPQLAPFRNVTADRYRYANDWRAKTGGKVIGCVPMYVPEEIVHAAGMLPINLLGGDEKISMADKYLQPYAVCAVVRSSIDLALKGKLAVLDGAIFPDICDVTQMVSDVWRLRIGLPFHHALMLPLVLDSPRTRQYLVDEFERLVEALARFGATITDGGLRRSIAIYNENRRLLARLYELRRQPLFGLAASDVADIVLASMLMPKEEHTKLLAHLLSAMEVDVRTETPDVARIVLAGYTCDRPEQAVVDFVERQGTRVVDDDLYVGRRYFEGLASETLSPLEALAERHLAGSPCVTKHTATGFSDHLLALVREAKADGLLIVPLKYCDPFAFEYPHLKRKLDDAEIAHVVLEVDERGSGTEQVRNRLQAFVELVQARREED